MDDALGGKRLEVDQQVAASDDMQVSKRWIAQQILRSKDHSFAQPTLDPNPTIHTVEEPLSPFGREPAQRASFEATAPCAGNDLRGNIRREHLEFGLTIHGGRALCQ